MFPSFNQQRDPYASIPKEIAGPADRAALITPSDSEELNIYTRGLSFAVEGALKVRMVGMSEPITIPSGALANKLIHPMRIAQVYSTGTTATGIIGWC